MEAVYNAKTKLGIQTQQKKAKKHQNQTKVEQICIDTSCDDDNGASDAH